MLLFILASRIEEKTVKAKTRSKNSFGKDQCCPVNRLKKARNLLGIC
jgi:hypothetical protein